MKNREVRERQRGREGRGVSKEESRRRKEGEEEENCTEDILR